MPAVQAEVLILNETQM